MFTVWLERAVSLSARNPLRTALVVVLLVMASIAVTMTRFDMTTDTGQLISADVDWRQNEDALAKAFPDVDEGLAVVIDGKTPELADLAAARLAEAMAADPKNFVSVRRPDNNEFFLRNGLLFAPLEDVKETTQKLVDAQPLLGSLAYDPSLRGVAKALETAASGAADDPADPGLAQLQAPLDKMRQAIDASLAGKQAWFSWQQLFTPGKGDLAPSLRQVVLARPVLRYEDLKPGEDSVAAVHVHAQKLGLDAAHGITLGVTGEVPLADEEFGSIEEGMGLIGAFMAMAMLITLWFATRSGKIVAAIAITIVAGLAITLALALLTAGRLNLISVAFIPLFVGLGVDFGIQVSVRFNAERRAGAGLIDALERAAEAMGAPILLAAGAICLALGAFLPTDYIGIAELGVISALGMVVALLLNVTLLPALLVMLNPAPPKAEVGYAGAAPVDRWLERNRKGVLIAFVVAMVASIAVLPLVRFDFNPLNLRDPETPAMQMLGKLMRDPQRSPNTLSVLASDADEARVLADKLGKLPEVRDAITLDSFIPEGQPEKLALIEDAALLLDATVNPFDLPPEPNDAEAVTALGKAAAELRRLSVARPDALGTSAGALAASFDRLAAASPDQRQKVETSLVEPLGVTLDKIRFMLQAGTITRENLPADISGGWLATDGRAMVNLVPKGDSTDNQVLTRFTEAVRKVAPQVTGMPVATQEAAGTVSRAFITAGILALVMVSLLLLAVLRSVREVAFTLAPVVLSGFLTLGCCVIIGQPLNFANIIAFPLLFGVGVAFHIYFVMAWRGGTGDLLQTSLARAVLFSALATGSAFGSLWFSAHPGTASMGLILMISLIWTLVCALIFEPALLGPPERKGE